MINRCQCTAHISGDWGPLWSCSKYFPKIQLGKNKVFLVECPEFTLFLVKVKNLDFFYKAPKFNFLVLPKVRVVSRESGRLTIFPHEHS